MQIVTGTTNERLARCGVLTLGLFIFAVWFFVDGWYRYPSKSMEIFQTFLKLDELPTPHPKLAFNYPKELHDQYKRGMKKAEVIDKLGDPLVVQPDVAENTEHWHYVGQYGRLALEVERDSNPKIGKVLQVHWEQTPADWRHESVQQQKFFSVICLVLGTGALVWLIKVYKTHVVVDETGLTYDGKVASWDAMTELDSSVYHAKGWLTLHYESDGAEKRIRLDSYKIEAFDDVVTTICDKKGFANPIPVDEYHEADDDQEEYADQEEQDQDGDE